MASDRKKTSLFDVLVQMNVIGVEHAEKLRKDALNRGFVGEGDYLVETGFLRQRELRILMAVSAGLVSVDDAQGMLISGRKEDSTVRVQHAGGKPTSKGGEAVAQRVFWEREKEQDSRMETASLAETREAEAPPEFSLANNDYLDKLFGVELFTGPPKNAKSVQEAFKRPSDDGTRKPDRRDFFPGSFADVEAIHRDGIPLTGRQIGKYLLLRPIGRGASAWVFFGIHKVLETPFAVKVLHPEVEKARPNLLRRFKREALLLMKLNHPAVVRVSDFDYVDGHYIMVMDYVEGLSVADFVEIVGQMREPAALRIAIEVVEGLKAAMALDIVHRDIKPSNMLLTASGSAKLTDFGLARWVTNELDDPDQTQPMSGIGTPFYSSPEQMVDATKADFRSDFYSLGATLYQMLTGRPPFQAKTATQVMRMHACADPIPPVVFNPHICDATNNLVLHLLQKDPDDRPLSHRELLKLLRLCVHESQQDNLDTAQFDSVQQAP